MTYFVHLSNDRGEEIKTLIEQPNELMAALIASKAYQGFTVLSVATYLNYSFKCSNSSLRSPLGRFAVTAPLTSLAD